MPRTPHSSIFSRKLARVVARISSACRERQRLKLAIGTIDKPRGAMSLKWCPIRKGESTREARFPIAASIQTAVEERGSIMAAADMLKFPGC
jgi:hypothetical protein